MVELQLILALPLMIAALASAAPPVAENIFPVSFLGSIVVPQIASGDTRVYYQHADNSIGELSVTGPFVGGSVYNNISLISADQVLAGTPISCALLSGDDWDELHIFFISPAHILSEWIWSAMLNSWRGGLTCIDCITVNAFVVQPGSQILYATSNNTPRGPALFRIAFISAGAPNTLSEASFTTARGWQLDQLST
ncbi:hypothetical protein B0H19DRAFT_1263669 [Mycena capillaripes]|nr:hypothetical protein B0H19DRAFT_1263669 [Mycena capillaripes]